MIDIGTRVKGSHGVGVVVAHNGNPSNNYIDGAIEALDSDVDTRVVSGLVSSFYSGDRYPNVVLFDTGYQDVYADSELTLVGVAV